MTILNRITKELDSRGLFYKVLLDQRHKKSNNIIINKNGFFSRLFFYLKNHKKFSSILCLGNVPPPIKCFGKVYLFFHNVNLLKNNDLISLLKRHFIKYFISNLDEIIVQTKEVEKIVKNLLTDKFKINIHPIFNICYKNLNFKEKFKHKNITFIYPASFFSHKNHKLLFNVFRKPSINKKIKLLITVKDLDEKLKDSLEKNNIYNLGLICHKETLKHLNSSSALIFPSKSESFGLPLVEAALLNKPVLKINLDYSKDIIETPYIFEDNVFSLEKCINKFCNDLPNTISAKLKIKDGTDKIIKKLCK